MKRVICSLLVVMLVLCSIPICGNAAEREQEIIRFEDGSYAVVETITSGARAFWENKREQTVYLL